MSDKLIEFFEEILEKEPGEIKPDDEFRNYEEWDSLAYISLVTKIDEEFDVTMRQEDFQLMKTINDIAGYIQKVQAG
ncbi:acyl carrier protein [Desulfonatronovibrio magnus]|uniref:acyl carrier protein n=1 Tax=Desulfonatronovibrio magnus TaxID=698827 RepID=UPI0005EB227C|nr:acyl carrier protein [Desulfonatronovibrio magnus]